MSEEFMRRYPRRRRASKYQVYLSPGKNLKHSITRSSRRKSRRH